MSNRMSSRGGQVIEKGFSAIPFVVMRPGLPKPVSSRSQLSMWALRGCLSQDSRGREELAFLVSFLRSCECQVHSWLLESLAESPTPAHHEVSAAARRT